MKTARTKLRSIFSVDKQKYVDLAKVQRSILLTIALMSVLYIASDIEIYKSCGLTAYQAISECFGFRCIPLAFYVIYHFITKFQKRCIYVIAPILAFMGVHIVQWSIIGCLTKLPDIQYSREGFIVILIALSFIGYTTTPKIFIPGLSLYFVNCVSAYIIVKNTTDKIAPLGQYITIGFPLALGFVLALMRLHKNWLEKESLYEKTEDLAFKDALTGAYNRNYMQNNLIDATDHFKFSGSIAIVDIDDFKKINDTFGHLEGDSKLKQLVNTITYNIRSTTDCVVRYGGEEFLIFFKDCSEKDAMAICRKILTMVHEFGFSFSGGLSYINKELLVKDNLKLIDSYLYYAKNNGKNQIISSSHMKYIFANKK